jgi:hypothetical protein
MIRRLLVALDLPHLRFVGVADDRPKRIGRVTRTSIARKTR